MIPQTADTIRAKVREIYREHPDISDRELFLKYLVRYHGALCAQCYERLNDPRIPSEKTITRRAEEIKKELRENKAKQML